MNWWGGSCASVHALGRSKHFCVEEAPVEMPAARRVRSAWRLARGLRMLTLMLTMLPYLGITVSGELRPRVASAMGPATLTCGWCGCGGTESSRGGSHCVELVYGMGNG